MSPTPVFRSPAPQYLTLRPAAHADLDTLVELDHHCFGKLWSRDTYTHELDSPNSEIAILELAAPHSSVAPDTPESPDPSILGYGCVWAILDEAHITILGVRDRWRRHGLGEAILYGLLSVVCQRGLSHATLEVSTQNQAALSLYKKIGFRQAGCRKGYYSNGDDAAILWKSGLQHPQFQSELETWREALKTRFEHTASDFSVSDFSTSEIPSA